MKPSSAIIKRNFFLGGLGKKILTTGLTQGILKPENCFYLHCDSKALIQLQGKAPLFHIGPKTSHGLGIGSDIIMAYDCFAESRAEIQSWIQQSSAVHLFAALGSGFGTAGSIIMARWAQALHKPLHATLCLPFNWEKPIRHCNKDWGIQELSAMGIHLDLIDCNALTQGGKTVQETFDLLNQSMLLTMKHLQ